MRWYEITAPQEALAQKSLREQRLMVRSKDGSLFAPLRWSETNCGRRLTVRLLLRDNKLEK